ncbi:putative transcription factor interactor and regulator C3H-WRC/GRF family [Helianthus annuus]|nr:putative transcription factor interactor and regulator C3H-WRC/GRF family [Helianthus annuus]
MRIRKRFLSLYGGVTALSDLHGGNHNNHQQPPQLVQHLELHPNGNQCHNHLQPSSSDHTTQIGLPPDIRGSSGDRSDRNKTKIFKELESDEKKQPIKTDFRKESILCAEAKNHDLVMRGWLQGDCLVPTKKKRGSYGRRLNNDIVQDNEKNDDKCVAMSSSKKNIKKEKREGVIMEGSRCSRVNGRGWRCSQQTLVGYSLCEHHLGKGRVRNMTSTARAQAIARKDKKAESPSIDHDEAEDDNDDDEKDDDEEFKDWDVESMSSMEGTKVFSKKTKLGVVKARSLSSLLSQL